MRSCLGTNKSKNLQNFSIKQTKLQKNEIAQFSTAFQYGIVQIVSVRSTKYKYTS